MQKTIFITGASSGVGKAAAMLFQSKGWHVIATMRNPENETELTKRGNVTVLKLDVSDETQVNEAVTETLGKHTVDVVLNNAGYGLVGVLESLTDAQITRQIDTNLLGTIRVTRAFVPHFRTQSKGVFINVSSMMGLFGYPTCSVYSATKFAMDGFSESLAYEVAQFGVQVKVIAPGGIKTDFAGRSIDGGQHEAYTALEQKVMEGYNPEKVKQFATAESIAAIIYDAATDGKDQLRYIAGTDAIAHYAEREQLGAEGHYKKIKGTFSF